MTYSNCISSLSNVLFVGTNAAVGNTNAFKYLDVGGLIVTVYRIVTDTAFIKKVKEEFIEQEFFAQIRGSEYDFIDL